VSCQANRVLAPCDRHAYPHERERANGSRTSLCRYSSTIGGSTGGSTPGRSVGTA